jgi:tetratricopeptide (TPR) repeat protein
MCWAQGEQRSPLADSIREEDLPAGPKPDFGQPFPLPFRQIGPPPALLDSPSLPVLNEVPQGDEGNIKDTTVEKKEKKEGEEEQADSVSLSPRNLVALRFVEEGEGILEEGDVERASILFEQAIELAPVQPYSYYFLGRIAFSQGKLEGALVFLQKAELLFDRRNTEWLGETTCLRGLIAEDLQDFDEARSAYKRCLYFTPTNLRAVTALTRLFEEEPEPELGRPAPQIPQTHVFHAQPEDSRNRDVLR